MLQDGESEKYLGRRLTLDGYMEVELTNRIAAWWASFRTLKHVLCDRRLPLKPRLKLLQMCVASSILYAAGTWTLTVVQERRIRTAQRHMLRTIVGLGRRPEESWVEFIQRATDTSLGLARRHGVDDWVSSFWKQKIAIAKKLHTTDDGRWSISLLQWKPWHRLYAARSVGAPRKRWRDGMHV